MVGRRRRQAKHTDRKHSRFQAGKVQPAFGLEGEFGEVAARELLLVDGEDGRDDGADGEGDEGDAVGLRGEVMVGGEDEGNGGEGEVEAGPGEGGPEGAGRVLLVWGAQLLGALRREERLGGILLLVRLTKRRRRVLSRGA